MTYRELCDRLKRAGIESAEWDAELLFERFVGVSTAALLSDPDRDYDLPALEAAVSRREDREPLQYILGEWAFYRQTYRVSPACLIPRQDTEILVEQAVKLLPEGAFFADLCTGSGCIAISTLAERRDTRALAVELSEDALAIAKENAALNGVEDRIQWERADVLRLTDAFFASYPPLDAILSNPPYIRTAVLGDLQDEVRHEPTMALDGGEDGLVFYRALLRLSKTCLKPEGICLFEIGFDQGEDLRRLAAEHGFTCQILRDLGGQDRVAWITQRT